MGEGVFLARQDGHPLVAEGAKLKRLEIEPSKRLECVKVINRPKKKIIASNYFEIDILVEITIYQDTAAD